MALSVRATFADPAGDTVIVTVSGALLNAPSRTTNENVTDEPAAGAVNVGDTTVALDNVTAGPDVCVHAYVNESPSGSLLPDPDNVTVAPADTDRSAPASATGTRFVAEPEAGTPQASNSARPTLLVPAATVFTVNLTHVTLRDVKSTVIAAPALSNAPTETDEPSENVNVPDVT